jgi:predicted Zn finger-like uncharacterized protein/prepilin-type processing-associated H-X9-DG protein
LGAQIACPHCGRQYDLTDEQLPQYAGQTITCTGCNQPFTVARDLGAPAAGSASPPPLAPLGYSQPYPAYSGPKKTNGWAIASVICGALGCLFVTGICAIIFGIIGLNKTRDPSVGGKAMSITGISLGGALLLLSPCLVSIMLPSLGRARETANRVKCASNMRQIGQALLLYANENRGAYPPKLEDLLLTQDITAEVFTCPSSNDTRSPGATAAQQAAQLSAGGHLSYVFVGQRMNSSSPANAVLLYEPMTNHNNDGGNFLFGDGHVEFLTRQTAQQVISQLQTGQNPPAALRQNP